MQKLSCLAFAVPVALAVPAVAHAQTAPSDAPGVAESTAGAPTDARDDVPQVAFAYSAFGAERGRYGAAGVGSASGGLHSRAEGGGGARLWGSPIERLTLMAGAQKDLVSDFAPFATAMFRIVGSRQAGWAVSALATYKTEGFDELGGEVEAGALASLARYGWHADLNAIAGTGTGEAEVDGEARARAGYDVLRFLRLGFDGQVRYRLAGDQMLVGGRTWDAAAGPQALLGFGHFFGALTGGPSTMGIAQRVGWTAVATVGGGTF